MGHDGKKIIRSMRDSECDSFERACAELVAVLSVNSLSKAPPRRAVPISIARWHRWLYPHDDMWFMRPDSDALRDPSIGVTVLRKPHVALCVVTDDIPHIGAFYTRCVTAIDGDKRFHAPAGSLVIGDTFRAPYIQGYVQHSITENWYVVGDDGVRPIRIQRYTSKRDTVEEIQETSERIALNVGYSLTMRYEWQASVGEPGGASAMFPVSRRACADLFATRDALPGRSRRSSLRHFVEKHARRRPDDAGGPSDVEVRRYLRGQTRFSWNGLDCEIIPPAFDAEVIEASKC